MSLSLVPARVFSSYAAVTPEYLADRGVRLLLSDLDFTLAPSPAPRRTRPCAPGSPPCSARASR